MSDTLLEQQKELAGILRSQAEQLARVQLTASWKIATLKSTLSIEELERRV